MREMKLFLIEYTMIQTNRRRNLLGQMSFRVLEYCYLVFNGLCQLVDKQTLICVKMKSLYARGVTRVYLGA